MPDAETAIASPSNARIKAAVRLRDRRERETSGLTIVDGARETRRAIEASVEIVEAFLHEPYLAGEDARIVLDRLIAIGVPRHSTTEAAFTKVAFGSRADGIVLVVRAPSTDLDRLRLGPSPLVVVIEGVEKPGNLGAILRTADAVGADAVIAASPRTDLWNPNVIRASAGTAFSVPLAAGNSPAVLAWLRAHGLSVIAARPDGATTYTEVDLTQPLAIVLGNEAEGVTASWRDPGVVTVRLPMAGIADSLNVSVTAAVLLYEARRQRVGRVGSAD